MRRRCAGHAFVSAFRVSRLDGGARRRDESHKDGKPGEGWLTNEPSAPLRFAPTSVALNRGELIRVPRRAESFDSSLRAFAYVVELQA